MTLQRTPAWDLRNTLGLTASAPCTAGEGRFPLSVRRTSVLQPLGWRTPEGAHSLVGLRFIPTLEQAGTPLQPYRVPGVSEGLTL